jgi:hypothetical protein
MNFVEFRKPNYTPEFYLTVEYNISHELISFFFPKHISANEGVKTMLVVALCFDALNEPD